MKEKSACKVYFDLWREGARRGLLLTRLTATAQRASVRRFFSHWRALGGAGGASLSDSDSASVSPRSLSSHLKTEGVQSPHSLLKGGGVGDEDCQDSDIERCEGDQECAEAFLPLPHSDQCLSFLDSMAPRACDLKSKKVSFFDVTPLPYEERRTGGERIEEGDEEEEGEEGGGRDGERYEEEGFDTDQNTDSGHSLLSVSFSSTHRLTAAEIQVIREEIDGKEMCVVDQTEKHSAQETHKESDAVTELKGEVKGEAKGEGEEKGEVKGEVKGEENGEVKGEGDVALPRNEEAEKLKLKAEKRVKREKSERRRSRINRAINCQNSFGSKDVYF